MRPRDALKILTDTTAVVQANRQVHTQIQTALNVFEDLINKSEEPKKE